MDTQDSPSSATCTAGRGTRGAKGGINCEGRFCFPGGRSHQLGRQAATVSLGFSKDALLKQAVPLLLACIPASSAQAARPPARPRPRPRPGCTPGPPTRVRRLLPDGVDAGQYELGDHHSQVQQRQSDDAQVHRRQLQKVCAAGLHSSARRHEARRARLGGCSWWAGVLGCRGCAVGRQQSSPMGRAQTDPCPGHSALLNCTWARRDPHHDGGCLGSRSDCSRRTPLSSIPPHRRGGSGGGSASMAAAWDERSPAACSSPSSAGQRGWMHFNSWYVRLIGRSINLPRWLCLPTLELDSSQNTGAPSQQASVPARQQTHDTPACG